MDHSGDEVRSSRVGIEDLRINITSNVLGGDERMGIPILGGVGEEYHGEVRVSGFNRVLLITTVFFSQDSSCWC
jgi:hypothetical protein